jgi:hypothetical protein
MVRKQKIQIDWDKMSIRENKKEGQEKNEMERTKDVYYIAEESGDMMIKST